MGARSSERTFHRGLGGVQDGGDLMSAEAEYVAQHDHASLPRRQML
jgi:hypothetical protein